MTVAELIKALQSYPPDAQVKFLIAPPAFEETYPRVSDSCGIERHTPEGARIGARQPAGDLVFIKLGADD